MECGVCCRLSVEEHALDWFVDSPRPNCAIGASVFLVAAHPVPFRCCGSFGSCEGLFWVLLSGCLCVSLVSAFIFVVCSTVISGCVALFVVITHVNAIAILIAGIAGVGAPFLPQFFFVMRESRCKGSVIPVIAGVERF